MACDSLNIFTLREVLTESHMIAEPFHALDNCRGKLFLSFSGDCFWPDVTHIKNVVKLDIVRLFSSQGEPSFLSPVLSSIRKLLAYLDSELFRKRAFPSNYSWSC